VTISKVTPFTEYVFERAAEDETTELFDVLEEPVFACCVVGLVEPVSFCGLIGFVVPDVVGLVVCAFCFVGFDETVFVFFFGGLAEEPDVVVVCVFGLIGLLCENAKNGTSKHIIININFLISFSIYQSLLPFLSYQEPSSGSPFLKEPSKYSPLSAIV
jgi:hypothetical protein